MKKICALGNTNFCFLAGQESQNVVFLFPKGLAYAYIHFLRNACVGGGVISHKMMNVSIFYVRNILPTGIFAL